MIVTQQTTHVAGHIVRDIKNSIASLDKLTKEANDIVTASAIVRAVIILRNNNIRECSRASVQLLTGKRTVNNIDNKDFLLMYATGTIPVLKLNGFRKKLLRGIGVCIGPAVNKHTFISNFELFYDKEFARHRSPNSNMRGIYKADVRTDTVSGMSCVQFDECMDVCNILKKTRGRVSVHELPSSVLEVLDTKLFLIMLRSVYKQANSLHTKIVRTCEENNAKYLLNDVVYSKTYI